MAMARTPIDKANVIRVMQELTLWNIRVSDAGGFPGNIPLEKKDYVTKFAATSKSGVVAPIGSGSTGPSGEYTTGAIREGTKRILETQSGACHNFAQLALAQLLVSMLATPPKLPLCNIKIISNSCHTLVLLGHESSDCSNAAIKEAGKRNGVLFVDPWLAAMGNDETAGVFNVADFPYKNLLGGFNCVFDCNPREVKKEDVNKLAAIIATGLSRLERRPEYKKEEKKASSPPSPQHSFPEAEFKMPRRDPSSPIAKAQSPSGSAAITQRLSSVPQAKTSTSPSSSTPLSPPSAPTSRRVRDSLASHGMPTNPLPVSLRSESKLPAEQLYKAAVDEISTVWKTSPLLNIFHAALRESKVIVAFSLLAKKFSSASKLSQIMQDFFTEGMTPKFTLQLQEEGFRQDEIDVIKTGADVLNASFLKMSSSRPSFRG